MSLRRELMNYVGTAAIGGIIGYYAGAKRLLGLQKPVTQPPRPEDEDNNGRNSPEEQPAVLTESFEAYTTGSFPTNWSITQGNQGGTEIVSQNDVSPDPVDGTQMMSISWGEDSGEDTTVSGWPTDTGESYKPNNIKFSVYAPLEQDTNAWHFEANSPDDERVLFIIGGNEEKRFRFGSGEREWITIRDTYWSEGWHEVEFSNIDWETNQADISFDAETVQENVSFIDSEISKLEFRTRDFDRMDMLVDNIVVTLGD